MLFSRIISCIALVVPFGMLAVANPVELEDRASLASVENVVDALKAKADSIIPQIVNAANNKQTSSDKIAPLISELVNSINAAQGTINNIGPVKLASRATQDQVAAKVAGVVKDISGAIKIIPIGFPGLTILIFSLDFALARLLGSLNIVLFGVGLLVGGLLKGVAGLLSGLGFGLTLGLIGIKF